MSARRCLTRRIQNLTRTRLPLVTWSVMSSAGCHRHTAGTGSRWQQQSMAPPLLSCGSSHRADSDHDSQSPSASADIAQTRSETHTKRRMCRQMRLTRGARSSGCMLIFAAACIYLGAGIDRSCVNKCFCLFLEVSVVYVYKKLRSV